MTVRVISFPNGAHNPAHVEEFATFAEAESRLAELYKGGSYRSRDKDRPYLVVV